MDNSKRIPRVRILEKDFPANIPSNINDSFLEVVDENGKTIALFFLFGSLHKTDFKNGLEFAVYYDQLGDELMEDENWEIAMKGLGVSTREDVLDNGSFPSDYSKYDSYAVIPYGRLKFPYGLEDTGRKDMESYLENHFIGGTGFQCMLEGTDVYTDDCIDVVNFALGFFRIKESNDLFTEFFDDGTIETFINSGIAVVTQVAENLFTNENIDLFIDAANTAQKTEVLAFLLDYKNKHFPADGSAVQQLSI
jgi:hypothetical protein